MKKIDYIVIHICAALREEFVMKKIKEVESNQVTA